MNLTDDEIRVKCAEAMGIEVIGTAWTVQTDKHEPFGVKDGSDFIVPFFESDMNAAMQLCDRMREEGWIIDIHSSQVNWGVEVWRGGGQMHTTGDPSLARAICLVFLKTFSSPS